MFGMEIMSKVTQKRRIINQIFEMYWMKCRHQQPTTKNKLEVLEMYHLRRNAITKYLKLRDVIKMESEAMVDRMKQRNLNSLDDRKKMAKKYFVERSKAKNSEIVRKGMRTQKLNKEI